MEIWAFNIRNTIWKNAIIYKRYATFENKFNKNHYISTIRKLQIIKNREINNQ